VQCIKIGRYFSSEMGHEGRNLEISRTRHECAAAEFDAHGQRIDRLGSDRWEKYPMSQVVILDSDAHRHIRIRTEADARLGDARHFAELVSSEFASAAAHYPIFLTKNAETGAFFAGAVMGFRPGENLFLGPDGQAGYRPLSVRREPFFVAGENLALDLAHPRVSRTSGEPLFEVNGTPSACLKAVQATITQLQLGLGTTDSFIRRMLALDLVEPIDITLDFDDGEHCRLEGLYTISAERLQALSDADVVAAFRLGDLQLAYCIIQSLRRLPVLAQLRNDRSIAAG
jgi:hypothetical protein